MELAEWPERLLILGCQGPVAVEQTYILVNQPIGRYTPPKT